MKKNRCEVFKMVSFGERLRLLREEQNFGQKEIGDLLSVSVSSIGKYESGERTPSPDTINKLADFFHVSADFLLGRSEVRESAEIILTRFNIGNGLPEEALKEFDEVKNYILHKYGKKQQS
ncbi:helix-turn-helix protein [Hydrogenispora ethanolica]|jgi:transcriptional regulator with XRE-family HTH domain|uniref:Helix-turn-helix protein n=1 Tax=Hydrogenispora ethanolica TaxID=1082276 RepID=A0A4R1RQ83_HYDET|nr:helix-turn-helix transcriptional regulator [Hydrogenispora ethanolica]TCL68553.1 helix-turn-helix protein [Hydrogenispora ethanolica]